MSDTYKYKINSLNITFTDGKYSLSGKVSVYKDDKLITVQRVKTPVNSEDSEEIAVLMEEVGDSLKQLNCF